EEPRVRRPARSLESRRPSRGRTMGPHASFLRRFAAVALLTLASLPASLAGLASPSGADEAAPAPPDVSPAHAGPERPRSRPQPVVVTPDRFPLRPSRVPA